MTSPDRQETSSRYPFHGEIPEEPRPTEYGLALQDHGDIGSEFTGDMIDPMAECAYPVPDFPWPAVCDSVPFTLASEDELDTMRDADKLPDRTGSGNMVGWGCCVIPEQECVAGPSKAGSRYLKNNNSLGAERMARCGTCMPGNHGMFNRSSSAHAKARLATDLQAIEPSNDKSTSAFIDPTNDTPNGDADAQVEIIVGSVLKNGRFKCRERACTRRSFGRQAELKRHYDDKHAKNAAFWCKATSCNRSKGKGHRPFYRKDKLNDHVRAVHVSLI